MRGGLHGRGWGDGDLGGPRHPGVSPLQRGAALPALPRVCPQDPLLRVQEVLNGTEVNLQQLTALVDCRSLHLVRPAPGAGAAAGGGRLPGSGGGPGLCEPGCSPSAAASPRRPASPRPRRTQDYVQALTGFCYDGVEGLIYLALFSFVTALMFSSVVCSVPHTWQQKR